MIYPFLPLHILIPAIHLPPPPNKKKMVVDKDHFLYIYINSYSNGFKNYNYDEMRLRQIIFGQIIFLTKHFPKKKILTKYGTDLIRFQKKKYCSNKIFFQQNTIPTKYILNWYAPPCF